jgi:glycosyltransferase involved in cell wall biosynthesis
MPELDYGGVVYNGIDVSAYPFREDKEDFLLFLGRSNPDKGAHRAVEAARVAGLPLVMAVKMAHPLEREHWAKDVEPRLPEGTAVFGELGFDEKTDLVSRARALLFPIDWPVVATPRGAVPEVVDDGTTGFVVSVEDYPQDAAAAIRRLGEIDPKACRTHVEQRFSKEAMVSGYEAVFERAAG